MLEDGGEHDNGVTPGVAQHQLRGRDTEVGSALQHRLDRIGARGCRADRHVETGLAVIALLERRVEAGELELVTPLELQADRCGVTGERIGGTDGGRAREEQDDGHDTGQRDAPRRQTGSWWSCVSVAHADRPLPGQAYCNRCGLPARHRADEGARAAWCGPAPLTGRMVYPPHGNAMARSKENKMMQSRWSIASAFLVATSLFTGCATPPGGFNGL